MNVKNFWSYIYLEAKKMFSKELAFLPITTITKQAVFQLLKKTKSWTEPHTP